MVSWLQSLFFIIQYFGLGPSSGSHHYYYCCNIIINITIIFIVTIDGCHYCLAVILSSPLMASIHRFRAHFGGGHFFARFLEVQCSDAWMRDEGGEIGCLSLMLARFFRALWDFPLRYTMSKSDRNCVVPGCSNRQDSSCCKWGFPNARNRWSYYSDNTVECRLCGLDNCGNQSPLCQSVTFSKIPKDSAKRPARSE